MRALAARALSLLQLGVGAEPLSLCVKSEGVVSRLA